MLGKLIEKVIGERLQFQALSKKFIYSCQLGELKQCLTVDMGIDLIHAEWVKNCLTSILVFFPYLNHQLLPSILNKAGFDPRVSHFFGNYLMGRKTK